MGIKPSRFFPLSTCELFMSLMQSVNRATFLNVTCLFLLHAYVAAAFVPASAIVIVLFTSIFASL